MSCPLSWSSGRIAFLLIVFSLPSWGEADPALDQALVDLASPHFAVREAATRLLWQQAPEAQSQLEQGRESPDPEVKRRAERIWEAFQLGIFPDTPLEVVRQIYQFHDGNLEEKRRIIQQLVSSDNLMAAYRLIRAVAQADLRNDLANILATQVRAKLLPLLLDGSVDESESLLRRAALGDVGMRDYAVFAHLTGRMDDALSAAPAEDASLRTWLLRAGDQLDEALALSKSDPALHRSLRAANGEALAFCEHELSQPELDSLTEQRAKAFQARLLGDEAGHQAAVTALLTLTKNQRHAYSQRPFVDALLLNDVVEPALPFLPKIVQQTIYDIQTYRGLYREALQGLGLEEERPPFGKWVDERCAALQVDAKGTTAFQELLDLIGHLVDLGEKEEAERILELIFAATEKDAERRRLLVSEEIRLGLRELGEKHLRALSASGARIDELRDTLLPKNPALVKLWFDFLMEHHPEPMNRLEAVFKTWDIVDVQETDSKPKPGIVELLDKAYEAMGDLKNRAREDYLRNLFLTASLHEAYDHTIKFAKEMAQTQPAANKIPWYYLMGNTHVEREAWDKAAAAYEKAWELHSAQVKAASMITKAPNQAVQESDVSLQPSYLYLAGMAHRKAGHPDKGAEMIKNARLLCLGDLPARYSLATAMNQHGDEALALKEWTLIARMSQLEEHLGTWAFYQLANHLQKTDPAKALGYLDRVTVARHELDVSMGSQFTFDLRLRSLAHQWQAKAALLDGDADKALEAVKRYSELTPGNASIGEELLPLLEKAGKTAEAREFYDKTRAFAEQACTLFPKSAMAHNNLAWLDARSRRNLDGARKHAETAVGLKRIAAYLDTLAEVHFAMGDRAKALELSDEAVKLTPDDLELLGQRKRFQEEPLPAKRAEGE